MDKILIDHDLKPYLSSPALTSAFYFTHMLFHPTVQMFFVIKTSHKADEFTNLRTKCLGSGAKGSGNRLLFVRRFLLQPDPKR